MKLGHWWRAQNGCVDHAKLILLGDKAFRNWFNLMCVASAHDGLLPDIKIVAVKLRLTPPRAAAAITELVAAGLFDRREDGKYEPHDWNVWQFKLDRSDPTNAERQKRYRSNRNVTHNGESNAVTTVMAKRPETEDREQKEDRIGDARASGSAFTEGSKTLASVFWKALGFENALQIPPEFAGVDWRAVEWERAGWTADLIDTETRRIGPDKPLSYHEKVFATAFAKRQAPLPIVEVKEAEKLTVTKNGTSQVRSGGSLIAAINRQLSAIEAETSADLEMPESSILRISN